MGKIWMAWSFFDFFLNRQCATAKWLDCLFKNIILFSLYVYIASVIFHFPPKIELSKGDL